MINFKNHTVSVTILGTIVFILVMTFYPLVAVIPWFLSVPSNPISVSYRLVYLLLSIVILCYGVINIRRIRFSYGMYAFIVFWMGYIIRLVYDLSIRNVIAYGSDFYLYTFAIGGCFLPALAVAIVMYNIETRNLVKVYWYFLYFMNTVVFLQLIWIYGVGPEIFTNRLRILNDGMSLVNPIPLSRGGGMLAVMSLYFLLFRREKIFRNTNFLVAPAFLLGVLNLILGASRGPLASFFLIVITMLLVHGYVVRKNFMYFLKVAVSGVGATIFSILYLMPLLLYGELSIIKRTIQAFDQGFGEEVRAYQWSAAMRQIKESPVWGERIVEEYLNFYPHNIFIEIVLATGVIGGLLFLIVCSDLLRKFISAIKKYDVSMVLFFLLALQFMFGLSGLSIPTGWYFWMLIAVCLNIRIRDTASPGKVAVY